MSQLLNLGEAVGLNARLFPNKLGARDLARSMTYRQWNERSCRLANALLGIGLAKGDRVAILAYNCVEWMEIYVALAKTGLVPVPINFRLVGPEIRYIVEDAEARALIVQDDLLDQVEAIRSDLSVAPDKYVHFGGEKPPPGFLSYEALIERASNGEPAVPVLPEDTWALMYTSGTTGTPRAPSGVARKARSSPSLRRWTKASRTTTRGYWSCPCVTPTRCGTPPSWRTAARARSFTTARASTRSTS
jgi:fatty-acyl-CoA synthase